MIIVWTPCYDNKPMTVRQPEPDKLVIHHRDTVLALDFSDSSIVRYDRAEPYAAYIHRAWREEGVLHLRMPSFGPLREDVTIDYGTEETITWR